MAIDEPRAREVEDVVASLRAWAEERDDIRAMTLVGSWARGQAQMGSDVDVVMVVRDAAPFAEDGWAAEALGRPCQLVRRQRWGVLDEHRLRLPSGLEVELGIVPLGWAAVDPVDAGTARVVRDGCRPLLDRDGLLDRLLAAVHAQG